MIGVSASAVNSPNSVISELKSCYLSQANFLATLADELFTSSKSTRMLACRKFNLYNLYANKFLNKNASVWLDREQNSREEIGACLLKDLRMRKDMSKSNVPPQSDTEQKSEKSGLSLLDKCVQMLKEENLLELPASVLTCYKSC